MHKVICEQHSCEPSHWSR